MKHETLDADQFKDLMEGKEVDFSATTIVRETKTDKDRIEDKLKKDKAKKGFPEPQSS